MHRFFVPPDCISGDVVMLPAPVARQLARVLRSRPGDRIVVLDNSGCEYGVILDEVSPDRATGTVADRSLSEGEPATRITLYQAVLKADRFEFVLQKGTELGVSRFVPVLCARSVPRQRGKDWAASRLPRWHKITTEAAEQSRRGRLPALDRPMEFSAACEDVEGLALIPWELHEATGLRTALAQHIAEGNIDSTVSVFIGPEGGFTDEEVALAISRGITPVTLGKRVLRAETAGIASVAAILYELGELGG